jgi:putative ABC transport system permease protein
VVDDAEFEKLENPKIGTTFELNDHRGVIVGIARVASNGLNGVPTLYTTYSRAIEYIPTTRFTISYVLVQPKNDAAIAGIKRQVAKLGYVAFTKDEFNKRISDYYTYKTGIGTNILLMTVISFLVGLSISGQTFYTLHPGEPGEVRRAQGHRRQGPRAGLHDPVHGDLHRADRLRPGHRPGDADDLDRPLRLPNYAAMITFWNLGLAFGMVVLIAAISSYVRHPQGPEDRALRHLQGLTHPAPER